ncbi:MAG: lamin tail domain-containing protein, partial [Phycisphaerales bacterium]
PDVTIPASVVRPRRTYRVRCKMKDNTGRWSHWSDAVQFEAGEPLSQGVLADLRVTEVMYNPADPPADEGIDNDDFEFIELKNMGDETLDLWYISFVDGVTFDFNDSDVQSLGPGEFVLAVKNKEAFLSRYGVALSGIIAGEYNGRLANGGENVKLIDFWNGTIAEFEYGDGRGWPLPADGAGQSLVPLASSLLHQPKGFSNYGGNWRASTYIGGSPGRDDPEPVTTVVIDEVMAHTDYSNPAYPEHESNDWIELYNVTGSGLSLEDCYLSDDLDDLKKWAIPAITIPGRAGLSFDEVHGFHDPVGSGFGLDKAGEQVILSHLPGNSEDRVVDWVLFKGQERDVSLGRYPTGGPYWFRTAPSRDSANVDPLFDLQIHELMYHPVDPNEEYVELHNPTAWAISLQNDAGQWRLDGGVEYVFPAGLSIPADGRLLVVGFDPQAEPERLAGFSAAYDTGALTPGVDIVGPWSGALSNRGERVALEKPEMPDQPGDSASWVIVDEVIYADVAPWPEPADGNGETLQRVHTDQYHSGNAPANWRSATPSPGRDL